MIILIIVAILLAGVYLVYYQLPPTTTLSGAAGSSVSNPLYGVLLYQHPYYGGYSILMGPGRFESLLYRDISSIWIQNGWSARIYDRPSLVGNTVCLNGPVAFLGFI